MQSSTLALKPIDGRLWEIAFCRALGHHSRVQQLLLGTPGRRGTEHGSTVVDNDECIAGDAPFTYHRMYWKANRGEADEIIEDQGPLPTDFDLRWKTENRTVEDLEADVHGMANHIGLRMRAMALGLCSDGIVRTMYRRFRQYPFFIRQEQFVFITEDKDSCFIVDMTYGVDPDAQPPADEEEHEDACDCASVTSKSSAECVDEEGGSDHDDDYEYTDYGSEYDDNGRVFEFANHSDLRAYVHVSIKPMGNLTGLARHFAQYFGQKDDARDNLVWLSRQVVSAEGDEDDTVLSCREFRAIINREAGFTDPQMELDVIYE